MKTTARLALSAATAALLLTVPGAFAPAHAQDRAASSVHGRLAVRDQCIFTDVRQLQRNQQVEALPALLVPVVAGLASSLAQSALSGISNALKRASQEHAYTARATDGFMYGSLVRTETAGLSQYRFHSQPKCLIFWVPNAPGVRNDSLARFTGDAAGFASDHLNFSQRDIALQEIGITAPPAVYVEVIVYPRAEILEIQPSLVWYRNPLGSAGTRSRPTELTVEMATPSYAKDGNPIGTIYALSRIELPRMTPGQDPLRLADLAGIGQIYHPNRPAAGYIKDQIDALEKAEAALATAVTELTTAQRSLEAANVADAAASTPVTRAAVVTAQNLKDDKTRTLSTRETELAMLRLATGTTVARLPGAVAEPLLVSDSGTMGATNASVAFIVVREEDKFGMAIATALGAQGQALGTAVSSAVTDGLTPDVAWRPSDTTYLAKVLDVQAKQAALATAEAGGDPAKILEARGALLNAMAQANEAAVAADIEPPYPNLLREALQAAAAAPGS